jgi:hypothetical protein
MNDKPANDNDAGAPRFYILEEVARSLRKSERWLWGWLDRHPMDKRGEPFFRLAGRTKLFTADDIMRLFEGLPCPSCFVLRVQAEAQTTKFVAPTSESQLNEVRELLTRSSRRKS